MLKPVLCGVVLSLVATPAFAGGTAAVAAGVGTAPGAYGAAKTVALSLIGRGTEVTGRFVISAGDGEITVVPDCAVVVEGLEGGGQLLASGLGSDGARYHVRILEDLIPSPDPIRDSLAVATSAGTGPCGAGDLPVQRLNAGDFLIARTL